MKVGDLVKFKQISVGKHDVPPYSRDGTWRIGVLLETLSDRNLMMVLYESRIHEIRTENIKKLELENDDLVSI